MQVRTQFGDFLSSIADRGRSIIGIVRKNNDKASCEEIINLCHKLLSAKGEASGIALSFEIFLTYGMLENGDKIKFFKALHDEFSAKSVGVEKAVKSYLENPSAQTIGELSVATESPRRQLIIRLNQASNATQQLVDMRADLLGLLKDNPELSVVDDDFSRLFTSWFNGGFLELQNLNWTSPASVLEKIIKYEAVHGMSGWPDLKKRLVPDDRLIYGFFHPRLRGEPLIFIEVALTKDMPAEIHSILGTKRKIADPAQCETAVFYSISNCQMGLRGIPLGSFLIKQVVQDLKQNFPNLKDFVTLSPIPSFSTWLENSLDEQEAGNFDQKFSDKTISNLRNAQSINWQEGYEPDNEMNETMRRIVAWYLSEIKGKNHLPNDPVARFHLGNGAVLERVNWPADISDQGQRYSLGAMVNYKYRLDEIEENHERYVETGDVKISSETKKLNKAFLNSEKKAIS